MKRSLFLILFLAISAIGCAQVQDQPLDSVAEKLIMIEGDSIFRSSVSLDEVYVFGKLKFDNYKEKLHYYILRRKTLKVYPYAKLAAERLVELNDSLVKIKKTRKKKKYTKKIQKYIEGEFSEELKKLTRTEGQILVKLVHRQTGITAFDLVKELRNGWRAFWYQTTAKMFKIDIKVEFRPEEVYDDYLIEDILQRAFASFNLERQNSVLDFNFEALHDKWHASSKDKKE